MKLFISFAVLERRGTLGFLLSWWGKC